MNVSGWLALSLWALLNAAQAEVVVRDDAGRDVRLPAPAQRVVTLAPHLAELVFAIGAGDALVGVSRFTDFPAEAATRPSVGDAHAVDRERLLALKPDLILVWRGGMAADRIAELEHLGFPVYQNDIAKLEDVPSTLTRLGRLLGREQAGLSAAAAWRGELAGLQRQPRGGQPIPAFYQIWHDPLYTIGQGHYLNDFLAVCGARNVFAELKVLAPPVSREAVLHSGAQMVVLSSSSDDSRSAWARFPDFVPQKQQRFCPVNPDYSERPGPRLLLGVKQLCECMNRLGL